MPTAPEPTRRARRKRGTSACTPRMSSHEHCVRRSTATTMATLGAVAALIGGFGGGGLRGVRAAGLREGATASTSAGHGGRRGLRTGAATAAARYISAGADAAARVSSDPFSALGAVATKAARIVPSLAMHGGGVAAVGPKGTPLPDVVDADETLAHTSAQGHGVGLFAPGTETSMHPEGLQFNVDASMKIHDPIPRDALKRFEADDAVRPRLRFDIAMRNVTVLYYGQEDHTLDPDDVVRMGNAVDVLTGNYYDAMCYCRLENGEEFLTCRCEEAADPFAPPAVPTHALRAQSSHHDALTVAIFNARNAALRMGDTNLMSALDEAKDAAVAIHANAVLNPDASASRTLVEQLRDALYISVGGNRVNLTESAGGSEAALSNANATASVYSENAPPGMTRNDVSEIIQESIHLVKSFHCARHVGKIFADNTLSGSNELGKDDRERSKEDKLIKSLGELSQVIRTEGNSGAEDDQIIELSARALKQAACLVKRDPLLEEHLRACQAVVARDAAGEAATKRRAEEQTKEESVKGKAEEVQKARESLRLAQRESSKKKHAEEMNKMKTAASARKQSRAWSECFKHGKCIFGGFPNDPDSDSETSRVGETLGTSMALDAAQHAEGLPPTEDYSDFVNSLNSTRSLGQLPQDEDAPCEHACADTAFGNYTVCFVSCELDKCDTRRSRAIEKQAHALDQLAQVGESLAAVASRESPASNGKAANSTSTTYPELLSDSYVAQLQSQKKALAKLHSKAAAEEKDAGACVGHWALERTSQAASMRAEMVRQKHLASRRKFMEDELGHLEDDALASRLATARASLAAVESEYQRLTGEAIADSQGDTAAAMCFLDRTHKRNKIAGEARLVANRIASVEAKMAKCRLKNSGLSAVVRENNSTGVRSQLDSECGDYAMASMVKSTKTLRSKQLELKGKWAENSECLMQHECAQVKLDILREELRNLTHFDEESGPIDMTSVLGKPPAALLIPHKAAEKGALFSEKPLNGDDPVIYPSEEAADLAYFRDLNEACQANPDHDGWLTEFTLLEGGQKHGTTCAEYDNCFMDDDDILVRASCSSDDPNLMSASGEIWSSSPLKEDGGRRGDSPSPSSLSQIADSDGNAAAAPAANPDDDTTGLIQQSSKEISSKGRNPFGQVMAVAGKASEGKQLEHSTIIWNQQGKLKTKPDTARCYLHVYGCDLRHCKSIHDEMMKHASDNSSLSSPDAAQHSPTHFVGTYPIAAREGQGIVHVTGSKCGFGMLAGCGWISFKQENQCMHAAAYIKSHKEIPAEVAEEIKDGTIVDGDALLLLQKQQSAKTRLVGSLLEAQSGGVKIEAAHLGTAPLEPIKATALDVPSIENNAIHSTMKREMLGRDIATVEAWLNATSGRASLERENAARVQNGLDVDGLNDVYDAEAARSSRVVRCLNLARGTEVFAVLQEKLIQAGAIKLIGSSVSAAKFAPGHARRDQGDGTELPLQGFTATTKLDSMCSSVRNGADIAAALGLQSSVSLVESAAHGRRLHATLARRMFEAAQADVVGKFLEMTEENGASSASGVTSSLGHEASANLEKVQWELDQLSEILHERGVRDRLTSDTHTALTKLDPETYSMVVVRDKLRSIVVGTAAVSHPISQGSRFRQLGMAQQSASISAAVSALHDATRIPYSEFATLVNATLGCLCYNSAGGGQGYSKGSCGPAPDPYPVTRKYMLSPVFPLVHLPPSRNEVADRLRKDMIARVHATQASMEEEVKSLDRAAKDRAEQTTEDMMSSIKQLRKERAKLEEERVKHEKLLRDGLQEALDKLRAKYTNLNATLRRTMEERTDTQRKQEEQDTKLEEKRKVHMQRMNKMRQEEMKLEDALRLQNLQDEEKWRREEDRLDDLYIAERERRDKIRTGTAQKGEVYRLELLDHEKNLRSQYDKELSTLQAEHEHEVREFGVGQDDVKLDTDKSHRGKGLRGRMPKRVHGQTRAQEEAYNEETLRGNRRGGPVDGKNSSPKPKYWKYEAVARHAQVSLKSQEMFLVRPLGCFRESVDSAKPVAAMVAPIATPNLDNSTSLVNAASLTKSPSPVSGGCPDCEAERAEAAVREEALEHEVEKAKAHEAQAVANERAVVSTAGSVAPAALDTPSVLPFIITHLPDDPMTPELCAAVCFRANPNYVFAGVKKGTECSCSETEPNMDFLEDVTSCPTPCPGDEKTSCGGGSNFVFVYNFTSRHVPPGMSPSEIALQAEAAACRKNMTHAKKILDAERKLVDEERRKWEDAVVRLTRPKSCKQLLGLATGGGDGLYTIFPPEHTTFGEACADPNGLGYSDECARMFKGVQTYCDMTTDGGGWTLIGYAQHAALDGPLVSTGAKFDATLRNGSSHLNSLWVVQASSEMAFSWNSPYEGGENTESTAAIGSYEKALKFGIPNPGDQTVAPEVHEAAACSSVEFSPVTVSCLKGECGMPRRMYTGTDSVGVCEGHAYGLVGGEGLGECDWRVDGKTDHSAFYVSMDGTPRCSGIVGKNRPSGNKYASIPTTVGIWVR